MQFKEYIEDIGNKTLEEYLYLNESSTNKRYGIDVGYRSSPEEVIRAYSKISLGFISAALKQNGYHIKHVFEQEPLRIIISSRNWDNGEWVGIIAFNPENGGKFIIAQGFYNKDRQTASIQSQRVAKGKTPAEVSVEAREMMHTLKNKDDRHISTLKPLSLKRGRK